MKVKTLVLSYNFLNESITEEWLKPFGTMLEIGEIDNLVLRGNDLAKLSDSVWKQLCDCLRETKITSVDIEQLSRRQQDMLDSVLKRPSIDLCSAYGSYFHHNKKADLKYSSQDYDLPNYI